MAQFTVITETNEATVVSEYKSNKTKSDSYQSEAELEQEFIKLLKEQSYEYLSIHKEEDLITNLRIQLEKLNKYTFSNDEWDRFFKEVIAKESDGIVEKTRSIQEDHIKNLKRDDGTIKNIRLIDKSNIHNNTLQVINQYEADEGKYKNRYDVTVLVNGLPLVHIELKRRGQRIHVAFDQINRYERDSFWSGCKLYEYVQIFVISNGTNTKYYSNTTRWNHVKDSNNSSKKSKTSNSFEFTSFWADANNKTISDLIDFTKTFFSKHTILNILTKYCIFTVDKMLMVMRPYQIAATERILNRIEIATNYKKYGSIEAGGYIWHTTGSGKTLTSFKTAKLATNLEYIDKVIFVVDRQDLDYQTMREYDKFEKGAANSNTSTKILEEQLSNDKVKIIITTIQKLSCFIKKYKKHEIFDKRVVMIFDECHRSQFGQMHSEIIKTFKKYYIFGFTGTPIFAVNSASGNNPYLKTTSQAFGDQLHCYTIVDAINDKNVLPFKVDYVKTVDIKDDIYDENVVDINREEVFCDPKRISIITKYIIDNFNTKTYRNTHYFKHSIVSNITEVVTSKDRNSIKENKQVTNVNGFNSIFAVSSIPVAIAYYKEFKKQLSTSPINRDLKIAMIYSFGANEEELDGILEDEDSDGTSKLDSSSRDFLESAIQDYNKMFLTNYDTSSDKFQNYYKDVSLRMKNKEIDILIVVNMFLTGFDATTLNTLWVDKNLKMHGLIQAYSRTNRILNSVKCYGNIVCFRNLQKRTDDAISLFGDKDAKSIVLLKSYKDYYYGYDDNEKTHHNGYKEYVDELENNYPVEDTILGENERKKFINLFSAILRMRNLLNSFDEFKDDEILSDRDYQDYCSKYLDLKDEFTQIKDVDSLNINDDVIFETELLKQVEININYILMLVKKYHESHCRDKEILIDIQKAIDSSTELRSKKQLIEKFINRINEIDDVDVEWKEFIVQEKEKELKDIIETENLKEKETREYISDCFLNGEVKTTGTDIEKILPPISRFKRDSKTKKKQSVINKLKSFFERFFGM